MPLEQAYITVSIMLTFTINTLEGVQAQFSLLYFESW